VFADSTDAIVTVAQETGRTARDLNGQ
jgi:hypothetical protein